MMEELPFDADFFLYFYSISSYSIYVCLDLIGTHLGPYDFSDFEEENPQTKYYFLAC